MADEYGDYADAYDPSAEIDVRGCVVRLDDDGIYLHTNASHVSVGVRSVSIDGPYLYIDIPGNGPIVSMGAWCDETLTARGITAGPSGGTGTTKIRFHQEGYGPLDLSDPADYARAAGPLSNVWLGWMNVTKRGDGGVGPRERIAALEGATAGLPDLVALVADMNARLVAVEEKQPGSFKRVSDSLTGSTFNDFDATYPTQTFAEADEVLRTT